MVDKKYSNEFIDRFWNKVDTRDKEECWNWQGAIQAIQSKGYGSVGISKGKTALTHRVAYEISTGEIPKGKMVLHKCDNRGCVNPNHLYLGTHQDNMKDMVERDRQARGERNGRSRLTNEDVKNIRRNYGTGNHTQKQVADQFGVSISSIRKILSEEYWKLPLAE